MFREQTANGFHIVPLIIPFVTSLTPFYATAMIRFYYFSFFFINNFFAQKFAGSTFLESFYLSFKEGGYKRRKSSILLKILKI